MKKFLVAFFIFYIEVCAAGFLDTQGTMLNQDQMRAAEQTLSENRGRVVLFYWETTLEIGRLIDYKKNKNSNGYKAFIELLYIPIGSYPYNNKLIGNDVKYTRVLERNVEKNKSNIFIHSNINFSMLYVQDKENHFINSEKLIAPKNSNKFKDKEISFPNDFYSFLNEVRVERYCSQYRCEYLPYVFNGYGKFLTKVIGDNENKKLVYPEKKSGPSFDCSKSRTNIENTICNNEILANLDLEMSNLYLARVNFEGINDDNVVTDNYIPWRLEEIISAQKHWVKLRNKRCEKLDDLHNCLFDMYINRVKTLRNKGFKWANTLGRYEDQL